MLTYKLYKSKNQWYPISKIGWIQSHKNITIDNSDFWDQSEHPQLAGKNILCYTHQWQLKIINILFNIYKNWCTRKQKEFIVTFLNKFVKKLTAIRSDNKGEYINSEIGEFLNQKDMEYQLIIPHCYSQWRPCVVKQITFRHDKKHSIIIKIITQTVGKELAKLLSSTFDFLQNVIKNTLRIVRKNIFIYLRAFSCLAPAYIYRTKRDKLHARA